MVRASEVLDLRLEEHRRELAAYAYRMLGSAFEAEDAVQGDRRLVDAAVEGDGLVRVFA